MCSYCFMALIFLISTAFPKLEAQKITSVHLLDNLIRDYAFKLHDKRFKTGAFHSLTLPGNLSGIEVNAARFRCDSFTRYGAQVKEFHLGPGVSVILCVERVMLVAQTISSNWFWLFRVNELADYEVVSPILGLFAYNVGNEVNLTNSLDLQIRPGMNPITISFNNSTPSGSHLCARFEYEGKVTITRTVSSFDCEVTKTGHYAMVVRKLQKELTEKKMKMKLNKMVIGILSGVILGVTIFALLSMAIIGKVQMKVRLEKLERKAYEEEALQVSMVGHLRAPTAAACRTAPIIEHECKPFSF